MNEDELLRDKLLREKSFKLCEERGEHAVESQIKTGRLLGINPIFAQEWLLIRRAESERKREEREEKVLRSVQSTATGTWILAIGTIALVLVTIFVVINASKDARENREQQSKDSRDLLRVQVAIELDKEFDSFEMRHARRRLAKLLLNNADVTNEDRVPNFFDKLGLYMHQDRIDEDTVYNEFSMMVEAYWLALKQSIIDGRREDNASEEYTHFEKLYQEMVSRDKAGSDHFTEASPQEIKNFLISERDLPN